ncbi:hypothetical protein BBW68_05720 [Candidatus Erwinia dacicola]|uniref:Uncharacterized protein n=1 Tax=Candidatus Erwinia dacicola TaxID=252393 RepID=A0A1E7Z3Y1_9GAMM|nr:hypothetical protein BBW68_05720 [Candidatus Erwinia dacicola]
MDFGRIDGGFAAAVDTTHICRRDPLQLTFTAQIGFKFGENTQHISAGTAGFFCANDFAASIAQGLRLQSQVLIVG